MSENQSPSPVRPTTPPGEEDGNADTFDWSAFYDADGRIYYYNSATGESSWDPPEKFNPPPPKEEEDGKDVEEGPAVAQDDGEPQTSEAGAATEGDGEQGEWVKYKDDEGREYYYNSSTGATQWEMPENFVEGSSTLEDEGLSPNREPSPSVEEMETEEVEQEKIAEEKIEEKEPEEVIDPAVKRLEDAEKALQRVDAVMEPDCLANVSEVLSGHGGSVGAQKATGFLIDSFQGDTAVCGLLGLWLTNLRSSTSSGGPKNETSFNSAADEVRNGVQDVLNRISKERFTKAGGDSILNLSKAEAAFLQEMIDSERWRKLLIDLSATNKDSALLMYCLKAISKSGHHREIAKRVNQSDHFSVYNAMLAFEFAVVGKSASTDNFDLESSIGMDELVEDLRRTCTSTSYTYAYAVEMLRDLVARAEQEASNESKVDASIRGAIRKWHRLKEELEGAMVDPTVSSAAAGSSTQFRKRRLDVALTLSDLHQRQRRRPKPGTESSGGESMNVDKEHGSLEKGLIGLLRHHSVGTRIDDRILDQLLPKEGDTSNEIGKLMIQHPLVIKALLGHLFKPGSTRLANMVARNKSARLIALSVVSSKEAITKKPDDPDQEPNTGAEEITGMLLTASQLCELLENMVSFTVTSNAELGGKDASAGSKLCALSLKSATIAQGVIMWAAEITKNSEFVNLAAYPTLSRSMLSLVRIISARHPFTRREVMEIALVFLRHSNSEISYQKMNDLKEQSLRVLLFLIVQGEITAVLRSITSRLQEQGKTEIDASLIRYFVGGMLDVVAPPFSQSFVRQLGALLSTSKCMDALRSSYFGAEKKKELSGLVKSFGGASLDKEDSKGEDSKLVAKLQSIYKS